MTQARRQTEAFIEQVQASIPVPVRWSSGSHIASRLLTPEENQKVFDIIGEKRKVLACTVAQVWFAMPQKSPTWEKQYSGVMCFVRDSIVKSYFMRLIDINKETKENSVTWEQEIYKQFKYKAPFDHFHTFEGDFCNVGLNFCDVEEAKYFQQCVGERIAFFKKMKQKMREHHEVKRRGLMENSTENSIPFHSIVSNVKLMQRTDQFRRNLKKKRKRESAAKKETPESTKSSHVQITKSSKTENQNQLIDFSSDEESNGSSEVSNKNELVSNTNTDTSDGKMLIQNAQTEAIEKESVEIDNLTVNNNSRSHLRLEAKPSHIPLLKNRSHSLPRKRSPGTLKNVSLNPQFYSNPRAKKMQEKHKEHHSSIIKSLFIANKLKNRTKNEKDEVVLGRDSFGDSLNADQTVIVSENEWVDKNRPESGDIDSRDTARDEVQDSEEDVADGIVTGDAANDIASYADQTVILSENNWVHKNCPESGDVDLHDTARDEEQDSAEDVADRVVTSGAANDMASSGESVYKVTLDCSRDFSNNSIASGISFPSLPSIEKLHMSPSLQQEGQKEGFSSLTQHNSSDSILSRTIPDDEELSDDNNSSSKKDDNIPRFASAVTKVLDLRAELMKSIIAGKALKKVSHDGREKSHSFSCNSDVTNLLVKALEERNKSLRDSSDEEDFDEEDDEDWEENSEPEVINHTLET